jgi:preprotein translocase SecE subunit
VARDRKRAKQRRDRRGADSARRGSKPGATPNQPTRSDVPGALDHASAEVDEFDAALLRGAGGVSATPEGGIGDGVSASDSAEQAAAVGDSEDGSQDEEELELGGIADGGGGAAVQTVARERAAAAPARGGNRAVAFLQASWAELQRVQWPDRRQVTQATAVVLGFVIIAGLYLGLADFVAKEIVEFIL